MTTASTLLLLAISLASAQYPSSEPWPEIGTDLQAVQINTGRLRLVPPAKRGELEAILGRPIAASFMEFTSLHESDFYRDQAGQRVLKPGIERHDYPNALIGTKALGGTAVYNLVGKKAFFLVAVDSQGVGQGLVYGPFQGRPQRELPRAVSESPKPGRDPGIAKAPARTTGGITRGCTGQ